MDISGPRVTPSRPDLWTGWPTKSGLTREQHEALEKPEWSREHRKAVERGMPGFVVHRLRVEPHQQDQAVYYRHLICIVLGGRKDGSLLKVITPSGLEDWIERK